MAEDASRMPPRNRDFEEYGDTMAPGPLAQKKLEPLKAKPNWGKNIEFDFAIES